MLRLPHEFIMNSTFSLKSPKAKEVQAFAFILTHSDKSSDMNDLRCSHDYLQKHLNVHLMKQRINI